MNIRTLTHLTAAALLTGFVGIANAEQLAISEPGFEADGGWKLAQTGAGVEGLFGPLYAQYLDAGLIDPVPDCGDCLMYNNGPQHDVYQVLQATVQANTTYTLSIVAIDPTFSDPFPGGELRLGYVSKQAQQAAEEAKAKADGQAQDEVHKGKHDYGLHLLKPVEVDQPVPLNDHDNAPDNKTDGYVTWTYTFTTGDNPQGLDQPLRIEILGGDKAQSIFDNVSLQAKVNEPAGAAEPRAAEDALDANHRPVVVMLGDSVTERGVPEAVQQLINKAYEDHASPDRDQLGQGL